MKELPNSTQLFTATDPIEMADHIHALSMDKCQSVAAYGRGLKLFVPIVEQWRTEECRRSNCDHVLLLLAATNLFPQLLSLVVSAITKPGAYERVMRKCAIGATRVLREHVIAARMSDQEVAHEHKSVEEVLEFLNRLAQQGRSR